MKAYKPTKPYAAKIQIRPSNPKVYKFVKHELAKDVVEITEEFKLKEGTDILVSASQPAFQLCKKFKKRFNGETKVSRSLVGENKQAGKRIHRLTVLLRLKE